MLKGAYWGRIRVNEYNLINYDKFYNGDVYGPSDEKTLSGLSDQVSKRRGLVS